MEKESRVVDGAASRAFLRAERSPAGDECKANKIGGRREWWKFNARALGSRNKLNTVLYRSVLLRSVLRRLVPRYPEFRLRLCRYLFNIPRPGPPFASVFASLVASDAFVN